MPRSTATGALDLDATIFERTATGSVTAQLTAPEEPARSAYELAKLYTRLSDCDRAIEQLRKAQEQGYPNIKSAVRAKEFALLSAAKRFINLFGPADTPR